MNRAQRSLVASGIIAAAWLAVGLLVPWSSATPATPSAVLAWAGRIYLPVMLAGWWGGVRRLRRKIPSIERRTLAIRSWHATCLMLVIPLAVCAVTGASPLHWMAAPALAGLWVTAFIEKGGVGEFETERGRIRRRRLVVNVVMAGIFLLILYGQLHVRRPARRPARVPPALDRAKRPPASAPG